MTSAIAAAKYCKTHFDGASVMMIGEIGLEEALDYGRIRAHNTKSGCCRYGN